MAIIEVDEGWLTKVKENLPELPTQKLNRLQAQYGLTPYEADILIEDIIIDKSHNIYYSCYDELIFDLENISNLNEQKKKAFLEYIGLDKVHELEEFPNYLIQPKSQGTQTL